MFEITSSRRRARLHGLFGSIAVHVLVVVVFWHSKAFEKISLGIEVVHAAGTEPVWLPLKNAATAPGKTSQSNAQIKRFIPPPVQVASEGDHSTGGTEAIPRAFKASVDDGLTSDLPEDIVQRSLKDIPRLEVESPDVLTGLAPEVDRKAAGTIAYDGGTGRRMEPARLLVGTVPVYPSLGKTARIQGTVVLEATITESGALEDVTVITGHPVLAPAAVDAVRQWRYEPAKLNGVPIRSSISISVNFKLLFQ
jgi:TonB family protein